MRQVDTQPILIIAGPTASGKSAVALKAASTRGGVIINADSLQIYDGLPILTAQPSAQDQALAPHCLYAALNPNHLCSAGNWREMAQTVIEEALSQGRTPIIVGGTGLYIKTLIEGLSPMPDVPDDVRLKARQLQAGMGNPAFHAMLATRDPVMAARIDPGNTARLIRAWEMLDHTGQSLSVWQALPKARPPPHWRFEVQKIMPPREDLFQRCDARFESMMQSGVVEEVAAFAARVREGAVRPDAPLTKALGYKPLLSYITGAIGLETAISLAQAETRRYAKRQITWFRHQL